MEFTPSSVITRTEAVARIAERVCRSDEEQREARNRVSHRISYVVKRGELSPLPGGNFVFGDFAFWVRKTWPDLFGDWPCFVNVTAESTLHINSFVDAVILPVSLERCREVITDMHKTIGKLKKDLQAAHIEIEQLRPDAERWRKLRDKNKANASKPRK